MIHRVYIAGPYSAPDRNGVVDNMRRAAQAAVEVMRKGHDAHCPHTATDLPEFLARQAGTPIDYERWMRLDLGILRHWATAILVIALGPSANRARDLAGELGLPIFYHIDEVPPAKAHLFAGAAP